jgi:hypothetical protein
VSKVWEVFIALPPDIDNARRAHISGLNSSTAGIDVYGPVAGIARVVA